MATKTLQELDEDFELAITNLSFVRMDVLGIYVDYHKLPAVIAANKAKRFVYGYNRITKFLCRHVLPRLFPDYIEWHMEQIGLYNKMAETELKTEVRRRWVVKREEIVKGIEA